MTANRKIASLTPGSEISETGHKDISAVRLASLTQAFGLSEVFGPDSEAGDDR
jgi:hypothetical protein